ncbi:MAG: beta-lactamase family protein [Ruminococcaceae bacterium]|nr:beta-lactamase family protein [Oscillospiraceae bacterium]
MNFEKLDQLMDMLTEVDFPMADLIVTKDGETIYRKMVGHSDAEKKVPISNKDIYWIFSATKVINCIAAMRLVERGLIDINDPVSKYIPEFEHLTVQNKDGSITPAKETMKIVHLFTMTGGLDYDLKSPNIVEATDRSTLGLVRAMAKKPLCFEPGTRYKYSFCHDVLAAVVEVASGMRYSDYLQKNIFEPLGIVDMGFRPNDEQRSRFSAMYSYRSGIAKSTLIETANPYWLSHDYDSGGAGLFATVDEYIKIITTVACGGTTKDGYVLLRPETIEMMKQNRLCDKALDDFAKYGYGWGLCCRTHMRPELSFSLSPVGEMGWDGAAAAFVMIDTDNRIAMYFGTHIKGCGYAYGKIHPELRNCLYEGLAE